MKNATRVCGAIFIAGLAAGFGISTWKMFDFRSQKNLFIEQGRWEELCAHERFDIVIFGDSQVSLWPPATLGALPVKYCGLGGAFATESIDRFKEAVMPLVPRLIVIEIGTNDLGHKVSITKITGAIEEMVDYAKQIGAVPAVCSVLPVRGGYASNHASDRIKDLNRSLADMCTRNGVRYIDVYDALTDDEGYLERAFATDGLHLSKRGYIELAKHIFPIISS